MRKILTKIIGCLLLFISIASYSQEASVYKWSYTSKKIGDGKYEIVFLTTGVQGWQLYAPNQELGGVKTVELSFVDSSISFEKDLIDNGSSKTFVSPIFEKTTVKVYEGQTEWKTSITINNDTIPAEIQGKLTYFYGKNDEFTPDLPLSFHIPLEGGIGSTIRIKIPTIDINNPVSDCGDEGTKNKSILAIFLLGLLGGFIALLTPCVFPMIPLTVTFFTTKSTKKVKGVGNAVLYGFFIFLIYVLLTIPFHIAGETNPEIFNNISTNVLLNIIFFIIFIVFALSFFGLFELTLPSGIVNKAHSKSGIGNWGGIFFMALTLAIVSFSCTGPILGTLLTGVADQGAWPLTAGAAGFGIALGLPFALFAMFPNWIQSIPKSGGWLKDVKVVLGFIEVALAIKFFANADNVKQWGIMKREIFIGLWIIIGICIVLYLLRLLKIGHSSHAKKFSKTRMGFTILFAAFTLYLLPGVTNTKWARLSLISGFPPPNCYSIYQNPVNCDQPLLDYEEAIQLAKKKNKPVLIDFTGWACVNCRRMEENVWTKSYVEKLMKNEFILVSLYVDERRKLPATQQTVYKTEKGTAKPIITVGDKWATFQTVNFEATSQPQYAIISPDEKLLAKTKFYTPSAKEFEIWLQCGLEAFQKNKK
jgi:thiol:disulfide interchange protein DsbD